MADAWAVRTYVGDTELPHHVATDSVRSSGAAAIRHVEREPLRNGG